MLAPNSDIVLTQKKSILVDWDPAVGEVHETEQGKLQVDAAKAEGVKHFVWSYVHVHLSIRHFILSYLCGWS